jgi:adenylate cyclase
VNGVQENVRRVTGVRARWAGARGHDHDLTVLVERLHQDSDRYGGKKAVKQARRLARAQQDELRRRAFRLGATVYAERPGAFAHRVQTYWELAGAEGPELATGGIAQLASEEQHTSSAGFSPNSVERERKYLLAETPPFSDPGVPLRQGYLAIDGSVSVRVRESAEEGCTLTVKAGRGAVRTELEWPLTLEQFAAAWDQTRDRRIHKTRHRLPLGPHTVEIDVFHDDLDGLLLAEVEFESDDTMATFRPPAWFGPEVTDDDAYTNASLSVHAAHGLPIRPQEPSPSGVT